MEPVDFIVFRLLPFLAFILFLAGMLRRVSFWRKAPIPFCRGLARECLAAPLGNGGFLIPRRGPGFALHHLAVGAVWLSLAVLAARHVRYFVSPAPTWSPLWSGPALWAGALLCLALMALWMRRLLDERLIYLTGWRVHFGLGLFLLTALSGLGLRLWGGMDIQAAQQVGLGLLSLGSKPLPQTGALFALHLLSALSLAVLLPYQALPRLVGRFFNPALRACSGRTGREHVNPWAGDYAGDEVSLAAVLPGEPPLYTLAKYRRRLKTHWRDLGVQQVLGVRERGRGLPEGSGK